MKCHYCNSEIPENSFFCPICGKNVTKSDRSPDSLDKIIISYNLVPGISIARRYQIQKIIGRGGMGIVYHALDNELGTEVAIKVLPPEMAQDERARSDLKNEAKAAMILAHENIVRIYNFQTYEGLNFIVMEYVKGKDLSNILSQKGRFTIEETLGIGKQICAGLSYAHRKRIIHRDIKPKNLMLTEDGTVKITDFGIARVVTDTMSRVSQGQIIGTPAYMSPEQLQGKRIDNRSDIYSLGCCFYEFLSGKPPFSTGDIYHQHLEKKPERLEFVPQSINDLLFTCLAKKPEERFQQVEDLHKSIVRIEKGEQKVVDEAIYETMYFDLEGKEELQKAVPSEKKRKPAKIKERIPVKVHWKMLFGIIAIIIMCGALLWFFLWKKPFKIGQIDKMPGRLFIVTEPKIAKISIPDIELEFSQGMELDAGSYSVEVSSPGYISRTEVVKVDAGEARHVNIRLERMPGRLFVDTEPEDANVSIPGIEQKFSQGMELDAGSYSVEVSSPGYISRTEVVKVDAGEARHVDIRLEPMFGRLFIDTEPEDATIKVLDITKKYYQGIELRPGSYRVEVSKEGYDKKVEKVAINSGEEKHMRIELEVVKRIVKTIVIPSIDYQMVYIPPGTFTMGSPVSEKERDSDEIQHKVTFTKGFYIGATEITQGQWQAVMGKNPSYFKDCGLDCPVEYVSWDDCQEFIKKLNQKEGFSKYRLPTEAEWEYACRAGTSTPFSFGACMSSSQVNFNGKYPLPGCKKSGYLEKPLAVKSFSSNPWGLYDMHGNVWEWCQDWYGAYPSSPVADPEGPLEGSFRVRRGGSWGSSANSCRSGDRGNLSPNYHYNSLGFRLARTP